MRATPVNIARKIRPGGYFMMMEPKGEFMVIWDRWLWYKRVSWIETETGIALRHDDIVALAQPIFKPLRITYFNRLSLFYPN